MTSPLVSIVTPSLNSGAYIEDTLQSVRDQSYENVEHIVVDGDSEDQTQAFLRSYEDKYNLTWVSEPDDGMYQAIERGFEMANGDIFAWLNADDMYLPWAVEVAVDHLTNDDIEWVTGHPAYWDEEDRLVETNLFRPYYRREWINGGWYRRSLLGFLQQESMFWTHELWDRHGGFPEDSGLAGDYYLWRQFAESADLQQVGTVLAGFRRHDDQLTADIGVYEAHLPSAGPLGIIPGMSLIHVLYSLFMGMTDRIS